MENKIREIIIKNVTSNLPHIRKELNLTQQAFADKIGAKQKTLAAIEEGRTLSIITLYRISIFTGISLDTLLKTDMKNSHEVWG